jgi:hypothetical protein
MGGAISTVDCSCRWSRLEDESGVSTLERLRRLVVVDICYSKLLEAYTQAPSFIVCSDCIGTTNPSAVCSMRQGSPQQSAE